MEHCVDDNLLAPPLQKGGKVKYSKCSDIPSDVLEALIDLFAEKCTMPLNPGDVSTMNFYAGRQSVVEELRIERRSRTRKSQEQLDNVV